MLISTTTGCTLPQSLHLVSAFVSGTSGKARRGVWVSEAAFLCILARRERGTGREGKAR